MNNLLRSILLTITTIGISVNISIAQNEIDSQSDNVAIENDSGENISGANPKWSSAQLLTRKIATAYYYRDKISNPKNEEEKFDSVIEAIDLLELAEYEEIGKNIFKIKKQSNQILQTIEGLLPDANSELRTNAIVEFKDYDFEKQEFVIDFFSTRFLTHPFGVVEFSGTSGNSKVKLYSFKAKDILPIKITEDKAEAIYDKHSSESGKLKAPVEMLFRIGKPGPNKDSLSVIVTAVRFVE